MQTRRRECRMRVTHLISLKWLALTLVVARSLSAQAPGSAPVAREGRLIPIPYRTYVAFDPSIIVFDFGSFQFERGVAPGLTIGGVGSYTTIDRDRYASGDLNVRYYPGEVVLRGLSFGISAGMLRFTGRDSIDARHTITAPTIGVLGHYN